MPDALDDPDAQEAPGQVPDIPQETQDAIEVARDAPEDSLWVNAGGGPVPISLSGITSGGTPGMTELRPLYMAVSLSESSCVFLA